MPRALLTDFELANAYYAGWSVTAYVVNSSFVKTAALAPIYAAQVGSTQLSNPVVLDSEGKFPQPAYVDQPVVLVATDGSDSLELGVTGAMNRWRGAWAAGTLYLAGERIRHPSSPSTYICATGHTSSNFATELAALYWEEEIDADAMADAAAAGLLGTVIPVSPAEYFLRSNTAGNDLELRSPAQVLDDIGAPASTDVMLLDGSQPMTDELTLSGNPAGATSAIPKSYFDLIIPKVKIWNRAGNPSFWIDQRNSFAILTPAASIYAADRWQMAVTQASKLTLQIRADKIFTGARNHLRLTTAAAFTPGATDSFQLVQGIEGVDVADFLLGTASALPFLLRFRAKASVAGTYSGSIRNSALNRSYPFSYSLAANTSTVVPLIIPGDTSGTWLDDSGVGMYLTFDLGQGSNYRSASANAWQAGDYKGVVGAVQLVANAGATFEISGIEILPLPSLTFALPEFGPSIRQDDELKCLRYAWKLDVGHQVYGSDAGGAGTYCFQTTAYPVPMRIIPSNPVNSGHGQWSGGSNLSSGTPGVGFGMTRAGIYAMQLYIQSGAAGGFSAVYDAGNLLNADYF